MLAQILIAVTLASLGFVSGDLYSNCYPYETYCLFSFGPNVNVNNVSEAQKICEDAKNGSWLLEIVDNRTLKNVNEFLIKYSFPEDTKLILDVGINNKSVKNKNLTSSNKTKENFQFSFICMTGCSSNFERHQSKRFYGATQLRGKTLNQCREECEVSVCEAYEWENETGKDYGCWIHTSIQGNKMDNNKNGNLYIINRLVKSSDICVGKGKVTESFVKNTTRIATLFHGKHTTGTSFHAKQTTVIIKLSPDINQTTLMKVVLACVIPSIVVISIIVIVVIVLWRRILKRRKKSNDISVQKPDVSSVNAAYTPDPAQGRLSADYEYESTDKYSTIDIEDEHVYMHLRCPPNSSTC